MSKKVRIIGMVIMAVAVVFLVRRFLSFQVDFSELFTVKTVPGIIFMTVAVMATLIIGSWVWNIWLSFFSKHKVSALATYSVYAKSNIAKYLPGNVAQYALRQLFGSSLGIKQKELLFSTILEIFCMAFAAIILSLVFAKNVLFTYLSDIFQKSWTLPVLIIIIVLLVVIVIIFLKKRISISEVIAYLKQKTFCFSMIKNLGLMICYMAIYGITLYALFYIIANVNSHIILIISAGIVSWCVGFLTPGVPGGIGVREAVLLLMLSPVISDEIVLFVALIQRIAYIISDVLSWIIGKVIGEKIKYHKS